MSLWKRVVRTSGFVNKLNVLFRSPAFKYENEVEVKELTHKINEPSKNTLIYSGLWFLIVIGLTANLLFNYTNYNLNFILCYVFFVLWSLWNIGSLNDGDKYAITLEWVRIFVLCVGIFWLLWFVNVSWVIGVGISVLLFAGILLLKENPVSGKKTGLK